jgi:regulator of replication initiation timing
MQHLIVPLSEAEEAILELMKQVSRLETENELLKQENEHLRSEIMEKD